MAENKRCEELPKVVLRRSVGRAILADLAKERETPVQDIVGRRREFDALRVEFMRRARAAGIGCIIIGRILGRDYSTILYHLSPEIQERKHWQRERSAGRRRLKQEIFDYANPG